MIDELIKKLRVADDIKNYNYNQFLYKNISVLQFLFPNNNCIYVWINMEGHIYQLPNICIILPGIIYTYLIWMKIFRDCVSVLLAIIFMHLTRRK